MTENPSKREMLEEAGKRASTKQPDEIHLIPAPQHQWSNTSVIENICAALLNLGFADTGSYTVDVLPVALRFFLRSRENVYSVVYEHAKAGVWVNLVVLYENGSSMTFTTTGDRGLEQRPGHPIVHAPGTDAAQLHASVLAKAPRQGRKALSPQSIVSEFERAWAEGIRWRKEQGISVTEVASVMVSRSGQPARILRPDRIQYIAEQDGPPERGLKEEFVKHFVGYPGIEKAYLVYVRYDEMPEGSVALCLISETKDLKLAESIRNTFSTRFNKGQHLDIMFVSKTEAQRIDRVCRPFYP